MNLVYKYLLQPTESQKEELFCIFKYCRHLYNAALEERISFYKHFNKSRSYVDQANFLPEIKKFFPELENIHSQVLQQTLKRLDRAYQGFFRRCREHKTNKNIKVGFPRFKNRDMFNSICFPQVDPELKILKGVQLLNNKVKIKGITGLVKVKIHRPFKGKCVQVEIVKSNHNFFFCITCEDAVEVEPLEKTNKVIAMDLGITPFITLDDGTTFLHPKPYKTAKEKLAYRQRKLARKVQGSNNYKKQAKLVSKTHEKIVNVREDFQHKLANKLVKDYDTIIVENLNVKSMMEHHGYEVSKSNIQDTSWGKFITKLSYKSVRANKVLIKVNPKNTSKMCSSCKNIKEDLKLKDRIYHCDICGLTLDRDLNAAKNIRALGTSAAIP